ncbi:LysR family transcriptional regulator [Halocynthiibacter namhaensis]|uniref:LysR family transcriptional regulator n=1 Tax=Halocynthiibacter namhaensis TaxID=1290553 RepID=UPI0005792F87|nr:LysR family transcriptional regulator [Halocynthiibacter namhaensis]
MENVNLFALSLQDIRVFTMIAETQSVSEAARNLNISQPTASYALEKLRRGFNDPLLVRTGGKMHLTAIGQSIADTAVPMLDDLKNIARATVFDPLTSDRSFNIMGATAELKGPYAGLPAKFRERAPNAAFCYRTYDRENCLQRLHDDIDIFVGANLPDSPSIERHVLHSYPVVVYYDPTIRSAPETVEELISSEFISYTDRHATIGLVDKALREQGYPPRKFRFIVNNFSSYADLALGTDILATASLAMRTSTFSEFAVAPIPAPLTVPKIQHYIGWSKRKSNMPCLQWLVELFRECNDANLDKVTI